MSQSSNILGPVNYDGTLVLAIELSSKSWVLAAQAEHMNEPDQAIVTPSKLLA